MHDRVTPHQKINCVDSKIHSQSKGVITIDDYEVKRVT